jgi:hypothetical protein
MIVSLPDVDATPANHAIVHSVDYIRLVLRSEGSFPPFRAQTCVLQAGYSHLIRPRGYYHGDFISLTPRSSANVVSCHPNGGPGKHVPLRHLY